jgi:tRNA dimethylallyltransferase
MACDPESALSIHPNNHRRVIRALEIFRLSGIPKSQWDRETPTENYRSDALLICLNAPREELYDRIDRRVEIMMEQGLYEEAMSLNLDPNTTAGQAIGYKELYGCFNGSVSVEDAIAQIQLASRRYAKRQLTWFRHQKGFNMIDITKFSKFEEIVNFVIQSYVESGNVV